MGDELRVTNEEFPESLPVVPDDMLTGGDLAAFSPAGVQALTDAEESLADSAIKIEEAQKTLEMLTADDIAVFVQGLAEPALEIPRGELEIVEPTTLTQEFDMVADDLAAHQGNLGDIRDSFDQLNADFQEHLLGEQAAEMGESTSTLNQLGEQKQTFELPPIKTPIDLNSEALKALESSMHVQLGLHGLDSHPEDPAVDLKDLESITGQEPSPELGDVAGDDFTGSSARESLLSGGNMLAKIDPGFISAEEGSKENDEDAILDDDSDQVFSDEPKKVTKKQPNAKVPNQRQDDQEPMVPQAPNALAGLSMLVGAVGMAGAKLFNVLGNGVEAGFDAWKEYRGRRNAEEYFSAFNNVEASLKAVKEGVLGKALETLPPEEHAGVLKQLLEGDNNAAESFADLIVSMDKMRDSARKYVAHHIKSGEDPEIVIDEALKPIAKLTEDNKSLLEKLSHNGQNLLSKMDGISNGLMNLVRDLIQNIARAVSLNLTGSGSTSPAPVSKGMGMS